MLICMKRLLLSLLAITASAMPVLAADDAASGSEDRQVFRSVGPDGVVEFSDQPRSGSEAVTVPRTNVISQPPPPATPAPTGADPDAAFKYDSVAITSPSDQHTFTGGEGRVVVATRVSPDVQRRLGHTLTIEVDGKAQKPKADGTLELTNMDRGEHKVQAVIVGLDGKAVARSGKVTFFVQRTTVINQPRGPSAPSAPGAPAAPGTGSRPRTF
jgi:hypothetical protein